MSTKNPQGDQDYSIPKRKPSRTPGGLGAKLTITSKVDGAGEVTYFINVEGVPYFIETPLAYALVRNGYAYFMTTQKALDDLFG